MSRMALYTKITLKKEEEKKNANSKSLKKT